MTSIYLNFQNDIESWDLKPRIQTESHHQHPGYQSEIKNFIRSYHRNDQVTESHHLHTGDLSEIKNFIRSYHRDDQVK